MTDKKKPKFGVFEGELLWPKLHEENMDTKEWQMKKSEGEFNTVLILKDSEELQKLKDLGFPEESMGNAMIKAYPQANDRLGVKLKRYNKHPAGIEDFSGAPPVTHGTTNKPWDYIEDGALGNGTKAKVKIRIWGEGPRASVQIEKVGILEHVPYDDTPAEDRW
jgi:hypothetical protein